MGIKLESRTCKNWANLRSSPCYKWQLFTCLCCCNIEMIFVILTVENPTSWQSWNSTQCEWGQPEGEFSSFTASYV